MPNLSVSFENRICRIANIAPGEFVKYSLRVHSVREFRRTPERDVPTNDLFLKRIPTNDINLEERIKGADGIYEIQLLEGNKIIDKRIGYLGVRGKGNIDKVKFKVESSVMDGKKKVTIKSNVCMNIEEIKDIELLRNGEEIPIPPMHSLKDKEFNYGISFLIPLNYEYSVVVNPLLTECACFQQHKVNVK